MRSYLKFILGDTPVFVLMDTGNSISHISLTKSTAQLIGIDRYPRSGKDGYIPLPGVGFPIIESLL